MKRKRNGTHRPKYDATDAPLRSWDEVVAEFNRRHPDQPIRDAKTARNTYHYAMQKIKAEATSLSSAR